MLTTNESFIRAGGVSTVDFYTIFMEILEGAFSLLSLPIFGIPLYVILLCIGVVGAIFALLSNKKNGDGK